MSTRCVVCARKFVKKPKRKDKECLRHSAIHACEAGEIEQCFANSVHIGEICSDCYNEARQKERKRTQMRKGVKP